MACAILCIFENKPGHGRLMIMLLHSQVMTCKAPGLWQNSPAKAPLLMQEVPHKPRKSPAKTRSSGKLGDHRPQCGATAQLYIYSKRLVQSMSPMMCRDPTMTFQLQHQSNQCSPWSKCRWQTRSNSSQRICQAQAASPPTMSYVPHCPHCRTILPPRFWASVLALTASLTAVWPYLPRRLSFLPVFENKPFLFVLCGHHRPLKHPKSHHLDPASSAWSQGESSFMLWHPQTQEWPWFPIPWTHLADWNTGNTQTHTHTHTHTHLIMVSHRDHSFACHVSRGAHIL